MIERTASIGYEKQIELAFTADFGSNHMKSFDSELLRDNEAAFTIIDVRNEKEVNKQKFFTNAINIPLYELRERTIEIPVHKPIVVHCAAGYRSAAGSSIIMSILNSSSQVFDLGEAVKKFQS